MRRAIVPVEAAALEEGPLEFERKTDVVGEDDLEILQVAAFGSDKLEKSGRTDVSAHRFDPSTAQHFEATAPAKG